MFVKIILAVSVLASITAADTFMVRAFVKNTVEALKNSEEQNNN